mmetsp:Transcript_60315/g.152717  ORF Transcript_60315/g.152717 Transcript_60315/m.152717 type:complete len:680 (+) Transcript_60315:52-2091(+)
MESRVEAETSCFPHVEPEASSSVERSEAGSEEDVFGKLTVGQLVHPGEVGCRLRPQDGLGDLAEALAATGRTAMAVVDDQDGGSVVGMVTVNDVMRAYFEGTPPQTRLSEWLGSGEARAPARLLQRLVVPPCAPLVEVAEKMVSNALAGDCACHHTIVQGENGFLFGIVSSHDLVRALCHGEDWGRGQDAEIAAASLSVQDVMKTRNRIFTCPPSDTMKEVLKILLVTQQNSVLVVDQEGAHVFGLITPRDVVKAFADVVDIGLTVEDWMRDRTPSADRTIMSDSRLDDAAAIMTNRKVDHLVVLHPERREVVGIVSSLEILLCTRADAPLLRSMPLWEGPTVAEVLVKNQSLTWTCPKGSTFGEVADVLTRSARTSTVVQIGDEGFRCGLLTENDIVHAYVEGRKRSDVVESWMAGIEPPFLQVLPSTPLTEAASLMLSAAEPHHSCHHLVVKDAIGEWLGVFSALDIARALTNLSTELDIARTGMEETTVGMVMKLIEFLPRCEPTDTIRDALTVFDISGQNALVVEDDEKVHGLLTPRCAIEALAREVPQNCTVAAWVLDSRRSQEGPREVQINTTLGDAAGIMAMHALHHLLVVEEAGGPPVGVLSSLDLARGIVSINYHCPFMSLSWLRHFVGPSRLTLEAGGGEDKMKHKRPRGPVVGEADASSPSHHRQRLV